MFRSLFPSFEKPIERPRYVNIEPDSHEFGGVGVVLLLAASCGVALALWEPSHQVTSPFVTAATPRSGSAVATRTAEQETIAAADAEDDQAQPTVKLSTVCSQRATARRDCADVKAIKDARLNSADPDPAPAPAKQTKRAAAAAKASSRDQVAAVAPQVSAVTPPAPAPRTAAVALKPSTVAPQTEAAVAPQTAPVSSPPTPAVTSPETPAVAHAQTAAVTPAIPTAAPPVASDSPTETSAVSRPQAPAASPPQTAAVTQSKAAVVTQSKAAAVTQAKTAAVTQAKPAAAPRQTATSPTEQPRSQKTAAAAAAAAKAKRPRSVPEDVIRAVREATVREVPVYRRGSYETVVESEYRPTRRVEAGPRYFGLQPSAW